MSSDSELKVVFEKYAQFGKTEAQKKRLTSIRLETRNISRLAKEVGLLDAKYPSGLLDNDVVSVIGKLRNKNHPDYKAGAKSLEFEGFKILLEHIAAHKKISIDDVHAKICSATSGPSLEGTTKIANKENVDRMTDTTLYTGSHKERFDESGKGKGIEGREDINEDSGYVGNYKLAGSYDVKHESE